MNISGKAWSGLIRVLTLALSLVLFGCGAPPEGSDSSAPDSEIEPPKPVLVATSAPLAYLVTELFGSDLDVRLLLPKGGDPAHGSPPVDAIVELQGADLWIAHGSGYEQWIATASLPTSKLIWTAETLATLSSPGQTHSHGSEGEHSHGEVYPSIWGDPILFAAQARIVHRAVVEQLAGEPGAPDSDASNLRLTSLEAELRDIDRRLTELFEAAPWTDRNLWVEDPSTYVYLADRYELNLEEWSGEARPDSGLWLMPPGGSLGGNEPSAGPEIVELDPMDRPAKDGYDYLAQARANVLRLSRLAEKSESR